MRSSEWKRSHQKGWSEVSHSGGGWLGVEDEGTNWEELALQARTMLLNNLVKDLNREGLTSCAALGLEWIKKFYC